MELVCVAEGIAQTRLVRDRQIALHQFKQAFEFLLEMGEVQVARIGGAYVFGQLGHRNQKGGGPSGGM
jgi:hypothetical protein